MDETIPGYSNIEVGLYLTLPKTIVVVVVVVSCFFSATLPCTAQSPVYDLAGNLQNSIMNL